MLVDEHLQHRWGRGLLQLCALERLIGRTLAGNPPDDIADELRDLLLEEIYSQRQAIGSVPPHFQTCR